MYKTIKLGRASQLPTASAYSPDTTEDALEKTRSDSYRTTSCIRCSGLFIREHVIGIHFSGFVMRCVNCGATEYIPVGPW